ncbi:two-component system, NtrC family, sensor histidine kinase PilS [Desulfuromusa kysingii]|uniref:histidine kinase n=1 Tax=Desulfuromusa kysingii TaxID=37625 RepID=A0A1H4E907_9BACT|nr:ATP-binding protein [Desulfuromusa kysingii]SEA81396.1 two-component system, NtrC family, sensor histidine kinase PilS [Desulfuromusa kysingii]
MTTVDPFKKQKLNVDNRSLTWYLVCRTAVITFLLGGAAILYLQGSVNRALIPPLFLLIGVSYAEALVSALLLQKMDNTQFFTQVQVVWDLLFVSALIVLTGGVESVFSFAYLLVIISASFLLSRRLTVLAAACAVILFGGILDLQYFNYLHFLNLVRSASDGTFFSALFVHAVAFFIIAVLSGTLAERLRQSEEQLQRKTIDYDELEKMNQTILAHIASGLMLINPRGRIRSFNRAATMITGLTLQDVYDQDAAQLFPGLPVRANADSKPLRRSEGYVIKKTGERLILGYATTPAKGNFGEDLGVLVTFQDLTDFKKIEDELKRTDRLAAVGRLAAGMAHEIRNPLASISGSVQLLMEAENVQLDDLKLMEIVVKEADRLNHLLTDFLGFARPKKLVKEPVNVASMLNQLTEMLAIDPRFNKVEIVHNYPEECIISLDQGQILQALWDLAVNAVEAMQGEGKLVFDTTTVPAPAIIVEDSGPGIADEIIERIFEPFFSTKEKGTGLGLASVYSVLESHGGSVAVDKGTAGGARFTLRFAVGED